MKTIRITNEWLNSNNACEDGKSWFNAQKETELRIIIDHLMHAGHFNWANWTLVRCLTSIQKVKYAVFSASQVLGIFEKKYPEDKRPLLAIKAALRWIKNPSTHAADAAYAAHAAYAAAAYAAHAAYAAAAYAADAADECQKLKKRILKYGLKLAYTKTVKSI